MLVEDNETAAVDEVVFSATIDVVKTHLSTQDIPEGDIPQLIRDINLCFLEIAESGEDPQVAKQPMIRELRQETPQKAPAPAPAPVKSRAEKTDEAERVSPTAFEQALGRRPRPRRARPDIRPKSPRRSRSASSTSFAWKMARASRTSPSTSRAITG